MTTISKTLLTQAGIKPRLKLGQKLDGGGVKSTGEHRVIFVGDRAVKGSDPITGKEREEVEYIFKENNVDKTYNVAIKDKKGGLNYFVQRMAELEYGDEIILEMKKKGIKNYIDVSLVFNEAQEEVADPFEDVPDPINHE